MKSFLPCLVFLIEGGEKLILGIMGYGLTEWANDIITPVLSSPKAMPFMNNWKNSASNEDIDIVTHMH